MLACLQAIWAPVMADGGGVRNGVVLTPKVDNHLLLIESQNGYLAYFSISQFSAHLSSSLSNQKCKKYD